MHLVFHFKVYVHIKPFFHFQPFPFFFDSKLIVPKKILIIESDSEDEFDDVDQSIVAIANDFKKNGISVLQQLN